MIEVQWTNVNTDPSNPVTGYRVKATTTTSDGTVAFVQERPSTSTTYIFHGLSPYRYEGVPGINYTVSVLAFNADGDGPPSSNVDVLVPRK